MKEPQVFREYHIEDGVRRVLLFQPAVCDIRFPWIRWQQPVPLLQLATALQRRGCDIRLVDALVTNNGGKIPKKRLRQFVREDILVNYWRWGQPIAMLKRDLDALKQDDWTPEEIYIHCGPPFQWEGYREAVDLVRQVFSSACILLFGHYPTETTEHALAHCHADVLIVGPIEELVGLPLDLSLYPSRPHSTHLAIGSKERPIADLLEEFLSLVRIPRHRERIGHIILADRDAFRQFPKHIRAICETIVDQKIKVSLHAFGGLHPSVIIDDPDLASLLVQAGFTQLLFSDDRNVPFDAATWNAHLESYGRAINACCQAGYQFRTDALMSSVCLGRPQEDLNEVIERMTQLAHIAGSVILLPYQPAPDECNASLALEECNGKLYPFASANGYRYRDYLDAVGLASVLDAKYRSKTFDFGGDGLISRLVRSSLITESWHPDVSQNHPVTVGWFNKDGKWTRT